MAKRKKVTRKVTKRAAAPARSEVAPAGAQVRRRDDAQRRHAPVPSSGLSSRGSWAGGCRSRPSPSSCTAKRPVAGRLLSAVVSATFRAATARHGKPEAVRTDRVVRSSPSPRTATSAACWSGGFRREARAWIIPRPPPAARPRTTMHALVSLVVQRATGCRLLRPPERFWVQARVQASGRRCRTGTPMDMCDGTGKMRSRTKAAIEGRLERKAWARRLLREFRMQEGIS